MGRTTITTIGSFEVVLLQPKTETEKAKMNEEIEDLELDGGKYWYVEENNVVYYSNEETDFEAVFEDLKRMVSRIQNIGFEMMGDVMVVAEKGHHIEQFRMVIGENGDPRDVKAVLHRYEAIFREV